MIFPCSISLRPTNWVHWNVLLTTTGPHKPMNIIRDSLLAKITGGYLKWLRAYGRNYYAHQHPSTMCLQIIHKEKKYITHVSLQGNNQQ